MLPLLDYIIDKPLPKNFTNRKLSGEELEKITKLCSSFIAEEREEWKSTMVTDNKLYLFIKNTIKKEPSWEGRVTKNPKNINNLKERNNYDAPKGDIHYLSPALFTKLRKTVQHIISSLGLIGMASYILPQEEQSMLLKNVFIPIPGVGYSRKIGGSFQTVKWKSFVATIRDKRCEDSESIIQKLMHNCDCSFFDIFQVFLYVWGGELQLSESEFMSSEGLYAGELHLHIGEKEHFLDLPKELTPSHYFTHISQYSAAANKRKNMEVTKKNSTDDFEKSTDAQLEARCKLSTLMKLLGTIAHNIQRCNCEKIKSENIVLREGIQYECGCASFRIENNSYNEKHWFIHVEDNCSCSSNTLEKHGQLPVECEEPSTNKKSRTRVSSVMTTKQLIKYHQLGCPPWEPVETLNMLNESCKTIEDLKLVLKNSPGKKTTREGLTHGRETSVEKINTETPETTKKTVRPAAEREEPKKHVPKKRGRKMKNVVVISDEDNLITPHEAIPNIQTESSTSYKNPDLAKKSFLDSVIKEVSNISSDVPETENTTPKNPSNIRYVRNFKVVKVGRNANMYTLVATVEVKGVSEEILIPTIERILYPERSSVNPNTPPAVISQEEKSKQEPVVQEIVKEIHHHHHHYHNEPHSEHFSEDTEQLLNNSKKTTTPLQNTVATNTIFEPSPSDSLFYTPPNPKKRANKQQAGKERNKKKKCAKKESAVDEPVNENDDNFFLGSARTNTYDMMHRWNFK